MINILKANWHWSGDIANIAKTKSTWKIAEVTVDGDNFQ